MNFISQILRVYISLAAVLLLSVSANAEDLPKVLILGDSISMGYTPHVQKLLAEEAEVLRPKENCAGTTKGIESIDDWLKIDGGNWDVIHFNFGLHDIKRVDAKTKKNSNNPKDPRQAEPEVYRKQLTEIVEKLKATDAKLIFCYTTPVPPGGVKPHRDIADPANYNKIAAEIMEANDIAINDLYSFASARQKEIMRPVNVHFTNEGSAALASEVAKAIRSAIEK
jgi:lysophospholipase L1-like esterase